MKFVYECIAERIKSPTPPLSPQSVLYTLLADRADTILEHIIPDYTSSYTECILATTIIASILSIKVEDIVKMVSEIGNETFIAGSYGNAIRNIRPRYFKR